MTKAICMVCEDPIDLKRGQPPGRCAVCKHTVCNLHLFKCAECEQPVCTSDLVNWRDDLRKTAQWKMLKCKNCQKALKAALSRNGDV